MKTLAEIEFIKIILPYEAALLAAAISSHFLGSIICLDNASLVLSLFRRESHFHFRGVSGHHRLWTHPLRLWGLAQPSSNPLGKALRSG